MSPKRRQPARAAERSPGTERPDSLAMSRARFGYLAPAPPRAIAHRGGSAEWTENTMGAFDGAVQLGFDYLELDVRTTRDGVLVVFHDDSLQRLSGRSESVEDCDFVEVATFRVGETKEPIARLDDVLSTFPATKIHLDVKDASSVDGLCELLLKRDEPERFCVACFAPRPLARLRAQLGDGYLTNLSVPEIGRLRAAAAGIPCGTIPGGVASVPPRNGRFRVTTEKFVNAAHQRGIEVHVWTIDDPEEMSELLDLGVDAIMTDRPSVLKDVLIARGEWSSGRGA
ncbi:MAG: glycerophosphodiester phosphodiesterase [Actinobacteria bacterium]|nr:glycerophosphodiester phosphodiesterase [Actinomycetota bacterium]